MMDAQVLLRNILRAQNEKLLEHIACKYELDANTLKSKYLSPSFYLLDVKRSLSGKK